MTTSAATSKRRFGPRFLTLPVERISPPVSKPTKTAATPPTAAPAHLDEEITKAVSRARQTIDKLKLPVLAAVVAMLLAWIGYALVQWRVESSKDEIATRLFQAITAVTEKDSTPSITLPSIDALVTDARGSAGERQVLKDVAAALLDKAFPAAPAPVPSASETLWSKSGEVVQRVRALAQRATEQFADDADMKRWSENILRRVEAEVKFTPPASATPVPATPVAVPPESAIPPVPPAAQVSPAAPVAAPAAGNAPGTPPK